MLCAGIFKDEEEHKVIKLHPMIIFRNLKKAPKGTFPCGMAVTGTPGGTMTKVLMVEQFLEKVLSRRPGAFFGNPKTLLIMDTAPGHLGDEVKEPFK